MRFIATKQRQAAFLMALCASLILLAYEIMRSSSYTLFKQAYGVESLSYIFAVLPFVVTPILLLYNKSLTKFGPKKTFYLSMFGSAVAILSLWAGICQGMAIASACLMLVREMYIVVLIEQVWSFINSCLSEDEGRELNGPLLALISMGPIVGGFLVSGISHYIGTTHLVAVAGLITFFPAILLARAYAIFEPRAKAKKSSAQAPTNYGFQAFLQEKNLLLILGMIVAAQIYATVTEIGFQTSLSEAYPSADQQTAISGKFFAWTHTAAFLLQAFVAPLLMRFMSVSVLHLAIPVVHCLLIAATFIEPGLVTFGAAFFVFKGIDYSVFRAAKEVLYIPLSFDARYRAKEWIDVLGYRASKGGTAFFLGCFQKLGVALPLYSLSGIGCGAVLMWFCSALYMRSARDFEGACPQAVASSKARS